MAWRGENEDRELSARDTQSTHHRTTRHQGSRTHPSSVQFVPSKERRARRAHACCGRRLPGRFRQDVQLQRALQNSFSRKHSQYCFRHRLFLQLHSFVLFWSSRRMNSASTMNRGLPPSCASPLPFASAPSPAGTLSPVRPVHTPAGAPLAETPAPTMRRRFSMAAALQRWQNHVAGMAASRGRMHERWHAWSQPSHSSSSSSRFPRSHTSHTTSSMAGQFRSPHTSPEHAQQSSSLRFG